MTRPGIHVSVTLMAIAFAVLPAVVRGAQPSETESETSIQRVIDRGRTMYLYDRAAWVTSDDLTTRLPRDRQGEVGGWIVTPAATGVHVDYFGKDSAADQIIYSADVIGSSISNANVYPTNAEPALTQPAARMAKALRAARAEMKHHSDWRPCGNAPFNTIVLPPQEDGAVPVYFLTPQTEKDSFPFGGHYEVDIATDGSVASTRAFTRSCISLGVPQHSGTAAPAGLFLTHLLDPHPTEIHVFEQYYVGVPVYVGTTNPQTVWKVADGKIEKEGSPPPVATTNAPAGQLYSNPGIGAPPTAQLVGIKATGARADLDRLQSFTNKSGFPNQQMDGPEGRELLIAFPPGSDSSAVTRFVDALRASSFSALNFESVIVPAKQ